MNGNFYEDIINLMGEGKSSDDIANMMIEALNKVQKEQEEKRRAEAKRASYMKRFADLVNEYFDTFEPKLLDGVKITEEECAEMLDSLRDWVKLVKGANATFTINDPNIKFIKSTDGFSAINNMINDIWKELSGSVKPKANHSVTPTPTVPKADSTTKANPPKTEDEIISDFLKKILN